MVAQRVKQSMASAIPRLSLSANPKVGSSTDIHEFSFIEGDVSIGSGTMVAPGTAVTAEQGASVFVGDRVKLLPGVLVEGVAGAQVMDASDASQAGKAHSVYIGVSSVVAHKSIVRSPAFVGANCFIGFRSTLFNARLGDGCIVMMHALIQDVEIPPGRCVPSGSIITSQHQADQLPKVRSEDLECAREVIGLGQSSSSRARYKNVSSNLSGQTSRYASKNTLPRQFNQFSTATEGAAMQAQRLSSEIVQQVRSYLAQGYRIGMEHADKRRYRSGVWETCTPIKDTREQAVFSALENCLAEHTGEYVRMFGIDPARKQRVGMVTVQRPGDAPIAKTASSGGSYGSQSYGNQSYSGQSYSNRSYGSNGGASQSEGGLPTGVAQEVRNLLSGGYLIGTEHAGPRHYRSNVWKVCSPIDSRNEREVFSRLEHCLNEHSGEYVRMFGIDSGSNSRTATTTIQRADGKPIEVNAKPVGNASSQAETNGNGYAQQHQSYAQSGGDAGGEVAQAVSRIIRSGNHIGVELADKRRYRSGIWQTAPSISASSESAAINQLQRFLDQNADKYVRIFGVNIQTKTRGAATTIQKPGQKSGQNGAQSDSQSDSRSGVSTSGRVAARGPINANPPHYDDPAYLNHNNGGGIDATVMDQVTRLINQGHKISIEFADKRRYRSGIWKTGSAINARRPAEAISALGKQLAQHSNDYVRLVGVDPNAKRRVVELTIQRPGQAVQSGGRNNRSSLRGVNSTGRDPINSNPPHYDDPAFRGQPSSYGQSGGYNSNNQSGSYNGSGGGVESSVMDQVTQLVNQGHKISVEYADKRRYRSGIWKTGEAIDARRPAEAISALGKQLARHQGEYVRLVGIDPQAKRRVLEATIQRP